MTTTAALALFVAAAILAVTPGPVVVSTVARGLASGFGPALAFACGVAVVDLAALLAVLYGLAAVTRWLGDLFFYVKIAGALYLLYLGVRLWLARAEPLPVEPVPTRFWKSFVEGVLVDLANPKLFAFYIAFLPAFVDFARLDNADVALIAGIVVGVLFAYNVLLGFLVARARHYLASRRAVMVTNRVSGTLMIGAAAWLATR
jgi:threonine/homoserine/homoserine lactone efflux protein